MLLSQAGQTLGEPPAQEPRSALSVGSIAWNQKHGPFKRKAGPDL